MKDIKRWFENDYENYELVEYGGHLEAITDIAHFLIVSPHSGTNNRWMLRVAATASFDRWANSTAIEEFFDSSIELCLYLYDHQLDIYKELLGSISKDYAEVSG